MQGMRVIKGFSEVLEISTKRNIYPLILWPLHGAPEASISLVV